MRFAVHWLQRWLDGRGSAGRAGIALGRWVVVDTETSGLDPERHPLLAIGAVAVDDDGIALGDSFEIVLKSNAPAMPRTSPCTGSGMARRRRGRRRPKRSRRSGLVWGGSPCGLSRRFRSGRVAQGRTPASGLPPDDAPWLDLAPLAGAMAADAYRSGGRSLDDWLAAFGIECAPATTQRPTRSPPPSCCCGCA